MALLPSCVLYIPPHNALPAPVFTVTSCQPDRLLLPADQPSACSSQRRLDLLPHCKSTLQLIPFFLIKNCIACHPFLLSLAVVLNFPRKEWAGPGVARVGGLGPKLEAALALHLVLGLAAMRTPP